jgi:hypothetical protein
MPDERSGCVDDAELDSLIKLTVPEAPISNLAHQLPIGCKDADHAILFQIAGVRCTSGRGAVMCACCCLATLEFPPACRPSSFASLAVRASNGPPQGPPCCTDRGLPPNGDSNKLILQNKLKYLQRSICSEV